MSHVHDGPLATYNSLTDSHLAGYFANGRMRRHLHKAGLVSRRGEIVSESMYRLNMSRREHKRHVKDMLAQAIVHKTLDMERFRQAEIKQKLEEIAKIEIVRRVRDERTRLYEEAWGNRTRTPSPRCLRSHRSSKSRGLNSASSSRQGKRDRASSNRKGDEDILPILTPRSSGQSPSPSPRGRGRRSKQRLGSDVPGVRRRGRRRRQSDASLEEEGDVLYLDDEGRPITPGAMGSDRHHPEQSNLDSRHLHSLDTAAFRKYAQLMTVLEEGRGMASPYMMPQVPLPPRPPSSARTPRSARRVQSASPRRNITTDSQLARLHRPETAKSHAGDQQTLCQVSMRYHGWALHLARERTDHTQEVTIEQQHCGGNTLTVFKERLEPGSKFEFISYRHRGYPFSLSLYVDGQMDSRVSTCCEYRHSRGAKIGGKQGHFSLLRVSGAVPCYKCQVAKGVQVPTRASPRRLKRPAEVRREEVIVVSTKGDRNQEKEDRGERKVSEPVEDFSDDGGDVVMIPVEGDEHDDSEHNESDTKLRNAQTDDYADDFEDSQASKTSKSTDDSSTSSSESESETPKEEENKKKMTKKGRQEEAFFRRKEDRGEERSEEAERRTTLRGREQQKEQQQQQQELRERDRPPSVRSPRAQPRVMVNSTGRGIDDYSSDEDEEAVEVTKVTPYERTKVVAVDDIDADSNRPIRSHRRSGSSSSSTSSSSDDQTQQKSRGQGGSPIINVDLLDKEEKKAEEGRGERERREELRRKEEKVTLQRQETEKAQRMEARKKAEEARRQEDLYRHQQKDEERRQREEERRQGAERERQRREEEEETRRRQVQIEEDPETRERRRLVSQKSRDEQIRIEQEEREEKRRREEGERAVAWKLEEAKRERKIKMEAEERERRRGEEGYSSARSETSTARSTAASSSAVSSSAESTPRHVPANKGLNTQDDDSAEVTRAASPLPAAAVYEDRRRVREPQEKAYAPPRPTSPLPAATQYEDRRRLREPQEKTTSLRPTSPLPQAAQYVDRRQERQKESPAARPVSPLPRAAVYEDRKRSRRGEEEEEEEERVRSLETKTTSSAPVPAIQLQTGEASGDPPHTGRSSTSDVSSTATSDDDFSDDTRSIEGVDEARQYGLGGGQQDSRAADSSSDSKASSDDEGTGGRTTTNIGGASITTDTAAAIEGKDSATGAPATSDSDGENMHGGADPDNVAQHEKEGGELQPLKTRELPAAKAHQGEITDLLPEGKDSVDLSNILLNKQQVYQLGSHLENSSTVKMVTLCNTGLDDDDIQRLSEALAASPSDPVMLNLSLNAVSQKGIQHVLHVLKAKPSIKLLILQGNPVGDAGVKELTQGLQSLHRETRARRKTVAMETASDTMSLDSTSSSIDPSARAQRYLLQELDLTDTRLTDEGVSHLAELVASNVSVENVNLSHNPKVTAEGGWKQMGEALARNRCVRSLTLDGNQIGDEGIHHLARGLQNNRVLRSLALEDAGIGPQGGKHLIEMLKRNTIILEMTLSPGNSIPEVMVEDIGKYIALNRTPYNNFAL